MPFNMPRIVSNKATSEQDRKDRIVELEAIAASLREDVPDDWVVECVGSSSGKEVKTYHPGHRWIVVHTPWKSYEIGSNNGIISVWFRHFHHSIEIPIEDPDSLDRLSRELMRAAFAFRDLTHVGN